MQIDSTYSAEFGVEFPTVTETLRGVRGTLVRLLAAARPAPFALDPSREVVYAQITSDQRQSIVSEVSRLREGNTRAERILVHRAR